MLHFNTKEVFIGANVKKANSSRGNDIFVNRRRKAKQKVGIHHGMCYSSGTSENLITLGIFSVAAVVLQVLCRCSMGVVATTCPISKTECLTAAT